MRRDKEQYEGLTITASFDHQSGRECRESSYLFPPATSACFGRRHRARAGCECVPPRLDCVDAPADRSDSGL